MKRETMNEFLARGGVIERIHYKTLAELEGVEIPSHSMRDVINKGHRAASLAKATPPVSLPSALAD